ncbi:MAG: hypothetical protein ABF463_11935 [Ethanoligenens sp.]
MDTNSDFCRFTPEQIATVAFAFAMSLYDGNSANELGVLSSFFFNVGSVVGLLSRQKALIESNECHPSHDCN